MKSFLLPISIITLASIGAVGAWHLLSAVAGGHLTAHCPLTAESAVCAMTVAAHLEAWQAAFAAVVSIGAALLLLAVASRFMRERSRSVYPPASRSDILAFLAFAPVLSAPSGIARALARGIVHPKLFASAVR